MSKYHGFLNSSMLYYNMCNEDWNDRYCKDRDSIQWLNIFWMFKMIDCNDRDVVFITIHQLDDIEIYGFYK